MAVFELCGLECFLEVLRTRNGHYVDQIRRAFARRIHFAAPRDETAILQMRADRDEGLYFSLVCAVHVFAWPAFCVLCFDSEGLKLRDGCLGLRLD